MTANLNAKAVIIDDQFPNEPLAYVTLSGPAQLLRYKDFDRSDLGAFERNIHISSPNNSSDSLAFIQHSAGTTGLQKGVALTHGAVLKQIKHLEQVLKIDATSDSIYSWLPLYHDMGAHCLLHAAPGLPSARRDAIARRLGDAPRNHAANHHRTQMHLGLDAEFCLSVCPSPYTTGSMGAIQSLFSPCGD